MLKTVECPLRALCAPFRRKGEQTNKQTNRLTDRLVLLYNDDEYIEILYIEIECY